MRLALRLFSGTAYARFAITNDSARRVDPSGFDERPQPQNHRSWVAAGIGDESGCRQRLCIQLGKPVHGFLQNFSCGRRKFVPVLKRLRLVKTERPAQIHDPQFRIAVELPGLALAEGTGGSKRAAEKAAASAMIAREGVGGGND